MRMWPSGSFLGLTKWRVNVLSLSAALCLVSAYAGIRVYDTHKAQQIAQCLNALATINIGDPAQKAFSLVERVCAAKPPDFGIRGEIPIREITIENWIHRTGSAEPLLIYLPTRLRLHLGIRYSDLYAHVAVEDQQVLVVFAKISTEGRYGRLTALWEEQNTASKFDPLAWKPLIEAGCSDGRSYYFLPQTWDASGKVSGIQAFLGAGTPRDVRKAARSLNTACLASLLGCSSRAELMPNAVRYVKWLREADP